MLIIVYFDMKYVPLWRCPTPPKIHELNVENNTLEIKSFQKYSQSIFLMNYRSILLFSELILVIFFFNFKTINRDSLSWNDNCPIGALWSYR